MTGRLFICYHGTNKENMESIRENGFNPWTYFGKHLEEAVWYGGEYIFEVLFSEDDHHLPDFWKDPDKWQFICHERVLPDKIVGIHHILRKELYNNSELRKQIEEGPK